MNNNLVIVRGVPGSGKTSFAKTNFGLHILCEADQYFERDGQYKFDFKQLRNAHEYCQERARIWLEGGSDVVVCNTFTRLWEMKPYLDMAKLYRANLRVYRAMGEWDNVHGVPKETVDKMRERFEDYPGEILINK